MIANGECRIAVATLLAVALAGCAAAPVALEDKDTTGRFDGIWVATVSKPLAKREELPGAWVMTCDWQPFSEAFQIREGMIGRVGSDPATPVSADGRFKLVEIRGGGSVAGGVASTDRMDRHFSGMLSESGGEGKYMLVPASVGANGCRANIAFDRS